MQFLFLLNTMLLYEGDWRFELDTAHKALRLVISS